MSKLLIQLLLTALLTGCTNMYFETESTEHLLAEMAAHHCGLFPNHSECEKYRPRRVMTDLQ